MNPTRERTTTSATTMGMAVPGKVKASADKRAASRRREQSVSRERTTTSATAMGMAVASTPDHRHQVYTWPQANSYTSRPSHIPDSRTYAARTTSHLYSTPVVLISEGTVQARVAQMQRVARLAVDCGIWGGVGTPPPPEWDDPSRPLEAAKAIDRLRDGSRKRARETWDLGRLATALEYLRDMVEETKRMPFVPLRYLGDIDALMYNQETLEMFAEFIRTKGSRQHGRLGTNLRGDTVDTYVSTVKVFVTFETHYEITAKEVNVVMPVAAKRARQMQAPPGTRKLSRGMRAHMLTKLAAMGYSRGSSRTLMRWAAALAAHNLLLRGGEVGTVHGWKFDPTRDTTFGAIEFKAPCADSAWLPWLTWDVVAIKDVNARLRSCPMVVRKRRATINEGDDHMCLYDTLRMHWRASLGVEPPSLGRISGRLPTGHLAADVPLFAGARGGVWDTRDTRELAKEQATALGLDPSEFGAKAYRIGGAIDWKDVFGEHAEKVITERGRWHSDIGAIYARALVGTHLRGSAAVGDSVAADLESMCAGWAQPASFR